MACDATGARHRHRSACHATQNVYNRDCDVLGSEFWPTCRFRRTESRPSPTRHGEGRGGFLFLAARNGLTVRQVGNNPHARSSYGMLAINHKAGRGRQQSTALSGRGVREPALQHVPQRTVAAGSVSQTRKAGHNPAIRAMSTPDNPAWPCDESRFGCVGTAFS